MRSVRQVTWQTLPLPERIITKLADVPTNSDDCWIWVGAVSKNAPKISDGKTSVNARGVIFRLVTGRSLRHHHVRMRCGRTRCVNSWHVSDFPDPSLTPLVYARRRRLQEHPERPLWLKKEGFCRSGHLITGKNVYLAKSHGVIVGRRCKLCTYMKMQKMGYGFAPGGVIDKLKEEFEIRPRQAANSPVQTLL